MGLNIYMYAFSRRFYPKRLTVDDIQAIRVLSVCVPWELNPQPFALLTQCSTTEPQEYFITSLLNLKVNFCDWFGILIFLFVLLLLFY